MFKQEFHENGGFFGVIPGACSDLPESEFPVQLNHARVAPSASRNHSIKSMIAGVGDLPGFEERAEALVLESRKNSCRRDVERTLAPRSSAGGIVKIDVFFEGAAADFGLAYDEPVGFASRPVHGVEAVGRWKYFAVEGKEEANLLG
jgi:hypothetical protein